MKTITDREAEHVERANVTGKPPVGRGLAVSTVAIDPAPFRGVLPLPISALKSAWPVLGNPTNRNRAIPLTYEQFRFASPTP